MRRTRISGRTLLREALRSILRHKSRSALTALGIAIGIAAVVWVVALGRAGSQRVEQQLQSLGENLVWVEAGSRNINGVRNGTHGATTLTVADAQALLAEVSLLKSASPQVDGTVFLAFRERSWTTRSRGVAPSYIDIRRWTLAAGERFTEEDVRQANNVCLLGKTVRERLFGAIDPIGQVVRIGVTPFTVVGILAGKGQTPTGQDQDDAIMVPYTTALKQISAKGVTWVDDIMCSAVSSQVVALATRQATELLRQRHRIGPDDPDDFNIRHPEELVKAELETSKTFAILLIAVASVALLVGGVGVMNVMLASVVERTREIGVRLAVGAPEWAVQLQFLTEAVVLTLLGGIEGAVVSVAGSFALAYFVGWPVAIPVHALALATLFSIAVGVIFGFYPARRAARLDPIAALRSD